MDWKNLVAAVLTPLIGAALKLLFGLIGFELDPATFNALVAAIVTALLALFVTNTGGTAVHKIRSNFLAKKHSG